MKHYYFHCVHRRSLLAMCASIRDMGIFENMHKRMAWHQHHCRKMHANVKSKDKTAIDCWLITLVGLFLATYKENPTLALFFK